MNSNFIYIYVKYIKKCTKLKCKYKKINIYLLFQVIIYLWFIFYFLKALELLHLLINMLKNLIYIEYIYIYFNNNFIKTRLNLRNVK